MKKVLCIGSVTTDVIVTPADTIPTPGTLRAVESVSTHVGGCAANAANNLAKLGVPVILSCKVGRDSFGDFVYATAKAEGADVRGVVRDEKVSTTVSGSYAAHLLRWRTLCPTDAEGPSFGQIHSDGHGVGF